MNSISDSQPLRQNVSVMIFIGDGYTVACEFYDSVKHQVEEVLEAIQRDVLYTAEALCGAEFWSLLSKGERRLAGRCLAHMIIVRRLFPLVHCPGRHEYPYRYKLI